VHLHCQLDVDCLQQRQPSWAHREHTATALMDTWTPSWTHQQHTATALTDARENDKLEQDFCHHTQNSSPGKREAPTHNRLADGGGTKQHNGHDRTVLVTACLCSGKRSQQQLWERQLRGLLQWDLFDGHDCIRFPDGIFEQAFTVILLTGYRLGRNRGVQFL
jgi:hypothetical protein